METSNHLLYQHPHNNGEKDSHYYEEILVELEDICDLMGIILEHNYSPEELPTPLATPFREKN